MQATRLLNNELVQNEGKKRKKINAFAPMLCYPFLGTCSRGWGEVDNEAGITWCHPQPIAEHPLPSFMQSFAKQTSSYSILMAGRIKY